jgi:hypothetical protein
MKLFVLFGQRKERYSGEYGPEALEVTDECASEDNPEWIEEKKTEHESTNEFESLQIIHIEVPDAKIMKRLRPELDVIKATVIDG